MKQIILIALVVALIVISAVQAVQLTTINAKIDSGEVTTTSSGGTGGSSSGAVSAPSSVQNLPQMVGGC